MPISKSGQVKFSELRSEFGGAGPVRLSQFYKSDKTNLVPEDAKTVPSEEGTIGVAAFKGVSSTLHHVVKEDTKQLNLQKLFTEVGWDGEAPVSLTIARGVTVYSTSNSSAALTISNHFNKKLTIINHGYIVGKGGKAGGGPGIPGQQGGPAISNSSVGVSLENNGAILAGGGGGAQNGTDGAGNGPQQNIMRMALDSKEGERVASTQGAQGGGFGKKGGNSGKVSGGQAGMAIVGTPIANLVNDGIIL